MFLSYILGTVDDRLNPTKSAVSCRLMYLRNSSRDQRRLYICTTTETEANCTPVANNDMTVCKNTMNWLIHNWRKISTVWRLKSRKRTNWLITSYRSLSLSIFHIWRRLLQPRWPGNPSPRCHKPVQAYRTLLPPFLWCWQLSCSCREWTWTRGVT